MPQEELGKHWSPLAVKQDQEKCLQHQSYKHAPKIIFAFRGNDAGKKVWGAMGRCSLYPCDLVPFACKTSRFWLYFCPFECLRLAHHVPCSTWSWPQLHPEAVEKRRVKQTWLWQRRVQTTEEGVEKRSLESGTISLTACGSSPEVHIWLQREVGADVWARIHHVLWL